MIGPLDIPRAIGWRWPAGPIVMFLLCFCGMMIGLAIDLQSVLPESIAGLCLGSHSFAASVVSHSATLPATSLLMFLSGFAVLGLGEPPAAAFSGDRKRIGVRLGFTLGCNLTMLAGMFLGQWLGPQLATRLGLSWNLAAMTVAMAIGMSLGMAAWTALLWVRATVSPSVGRVPSR